jgi:hypothetical protein
MLVAVPAGVLLAPGAGGSPDHPVFVALEDQLARRDVVVERYQFGYSREGKRSTPKAERVVGELADAATALAQRLGVTTASLVVGGRSFGGRVASLAVAAGLEAAGLALLSYPLHPPGKPDQLRVEHFGAIDVPVLLVAGDKDPFGRPDEMAEHVTDLAGPVTTVWIEGGTHDPRHRGREQAVVDAVVDWLGAG